MLEVPLNRECARWTLAADVTGIASPCEIESFKSRGGGPALDQSTRVVRVMFRILSCILLFAALTPEASEKLRKGNYERLFDEARRRVREWERANAK